jgi:iron complex outermembrane receptor protein
MPCIALQLSVPGLNFAEMAAKTPAIFIRGVGQKESTVALDPGVGVYINSIYIARTDSPLLAALVHVLP